MAGIALGDLTEALGESVVKALLRAKGGQQIWVPKALPQQHWAREALGDQGAEKLCAHFGGEQLILPVGKKAEWEELRAKAQRLRKAGKRLNEIVQQTGVHYNTLQRWLGEDADPDQLRF